jgi:hypothetical protein
MAELAGGKKRRAFLYATALVPSALGVMAIGLALGFAIEIVALGAPVVAIAVHLILRKRSREYGEVSESIRAAQSSLKCLQATVAAFYKAAPVRRRGRAFKTAYLRVPCSVKEFERNMVRGMFREGREVWVVAFCRDGQVVRTTASIGSRFRCRPADDPARWPSHLKSLEANELRLYHNHPTTAGFTEPSGADKKTYRRLRALISDSRASFRNFVVFWNPLGEWKSLEYNSSSAWLAHEWDALGTLQPAAQLSELKPTADNT